MTIKIFKYKETAKWLSDAYKDLILYPDHEFRSYDYIDELGGCGAITSSIYARSDYDIIYDVKITFKGMWYLWLINNGHIE